MPELPEVETVVRDLRAHGLPGSVIRSVAVRWPRTIAELPPDAFCRALAGKTITDVSRRAKFIVVNLDSGDRLLIHLRMTGKLRFAAPGERPGPHDHVSLHLTDGRELIFNDTRKFGRFRLTQPGDDPFAALGPEPLEADFTPTLFKQRLKGKTRQIKPLLLDQTTVAGLGNIYVDEALWQARIHPERRAELHRRRTGSLARRYARSCNARSTTPAPRSAAARRTSTASPDVAVATPTRSRSFAATACPVRAAAP